MKLTLPDRCLAVFVDDTGHEAFAPGHSVYGLGGCACVATDLVRLIQGPWREVRLKVNGSAHAPMHASAFSRKHKPEQIGVVADFFRLNPFARFGAIMTQATSINAPLPPIELVAKVLQNRIVDIAKWTAFTEVKIIFESSERADTLIQSAFADIGIEEDGKAIPVECFFLEKTAGEPALEVADFIMHAVGRQARRKFDGRAGFAPDFEAVFHTVDRKLASFMELDAVYGYHSH